MTLQTGLVGTDGILLVSDLQWGETTAANDSTTSQRSKILRRDDRKIAACWSGDKSPSWRLANDIVSKLTDDDLQYPHPALNELSKNVLEMRFDYGVQYDQAEVMVATIGDKPKLYQIRARMFHRSR